MEPQPKNILGFVTSTNLLWNYCSRIPAFQIAPRHVKAAEEAARLEAAEREAQVLQQVGLEQTVAFGGRRWQKELKVIE